MNWCPHCGAAMRFGVWLTKRQREIFDRLKRAGEERLQVEDFEMNRNLFKAHIWQINDKLEETDYKIVGKRNEGWRLEKVR